MNIYVPVGGNESNSSQNRDLFSKVIYPLTRIMQPMAPTGGPSNGYSQNKVTVYSLVNDTSNRSPGDMCEKMGKAGRKTSQRGEPAGQN